MSTDAAHNTAPDDLSIRASDSEREQVAKTLRDAGKTGRLSAEEVDERLATLASTRNRSELAPLLSDLPTTVARKYAKPTSVRNALTLLVASVGGLFGAIFALARRHRIVSAVIVVLVVLACVGLAILAGLDAGHAQHGGGGQRRMGGRN
ncbi:DUF1707 SHOCT-like domain-containing protein [Actinomycetes bacterium M1A6_2h]